MSDDAERWSEMIMDCATLCVAPVWASLSASAPSVSVDHNGTGTFIDTGARKILVTAHHVLAKVREVQANHPEAGLAVNLASGITPFYPDFDVLAEDAEADLAVLDFPFLSRWPGHAKRYFPIRTWPIPPPQRGDPVTLVGFPGAARRTFEASGSFSPVGVGMLVSNNPQRHVALVNESGNLTTIENGVARPGGIEPGGLSGAAGFFFRDDRFHLAGFVYEGSPDMLLLTPATRLQPDGSLYPS
ncbi:MAG: trypsin-like peptidase domain-containing protein [Opitutae bacterium]|nr:trypsin-like peptidase domain-containing protein [Opitutae bacterium]